MATGKRVKVHWRDPFLLRADAPLRPDAGVLQLVTARRNDGPVTSRGTVAVARTQDMRRWQVLPPLEHDRMASRRRCSTSASNVTVVRMGAACIV